MTRIIKIDNAIKKRLRRVEKSRNVGTRQKRVYFLIICEGVKTEPNYFKAFKKSLPYETIFVSDMTVYGVGKNTKSLVDYAIRLRCDLTNKFDKVWAVFDKDSFTDDQFNSAITKAKENGIECAWTNEAFELWFLLHFQFVNHAMSREDYQKFFEREVKRISGLDYSYKKNDPNTYELLQTYGNQSNAIKWAKMLELAMSDEKYSTHNPCTKVHLLIQQLLDPGNILKE